MDDGDSKKYRKIKRKGQSINFLQRCIFNVSDVFSSIWVRCIIQINNGFDGFILDSRYRFLFGIRVFLVIIFLIVEIFK